MSVTDLDSTVSGVTVVPTFTMPVAQLRDVLSGCVVAASKDAYTPTISAVRFSWSDGGAVECAATDRYRLAVATTNTMGTNEGAFMLARKDCAELVKLLPKPAARDRREYSVHVSVVTGFVTFRIDTADGSMTREYRTVEGDFPRYHSLIPGDEKLSGTTESGFTANPDYMADVAKLPHGKNDPVTWRFQPEHKPAVATYPTHNGVDWVYLLMPVRLTR